MLALLLLAHAQQLLCCDDTVFSATTQVQLLCSGVPLQPMLLCPHCYGHTCQPRQSCQKSSAVALAWCALTSRLRYQHQMRSSHVQFLYKVPSIHPQDGREERLVPLPPSCFGHLAAAVVVAKWAVEGVCGGDICQATVSHSYLQCHFGS